MSTEQSEITPHAQPWWEKLGARFRSWTGERPVLVRRLRQVRVLLTWASLALLVVGLIFWPQLWPSLRVWLWCYWLLLVWFLLARTKTVSWRLVGAVFGIGVIWTLLIAWISSQLTQTTGLSIGAGPQVGIASLTEETLKLAPLAVLAVAAPSRVRRFAAVDWLLVGLASGLAFQAFEDAARRAYLHFVYSGFLPTEVVTEQAGYPTYSLSPISGWQDNGVADFAGHHVLTALIASAAGLGVATWRYARRPGSGIARLGLRVLAVALPFLAWMATVVDHAGYNAAAQTDTGWLESGSTVPSWLQVAWNVLGRGDGRGHVLLALFLIALLVDARRLNRGGTWAPSMPGDDVWSERAHRWARTLTGWSRGLSPEVAAVIRCLARASAAAVRASCYLVSLTIRDVRFLALAAMPEGAGGARQALARGSAAAQLLRSRRERAMAAIAPGGGFPWVALLYTILGSLAATFGAVHLASTIGPSIVETSPFDWLAGTLDSLGEWWHGLSTGQQFLIGAGVAGLVVLSGGSFGLALGFGSGATWLAGHGRGAADFVRDPVKTTRQFFSTLTPQQALTYAGELALQRLLPAGVGGTVGRGIREAVDEYRVDPLLFWSRRRVDIRDEAGIWESRNEAMSQRARRYQEQITGLPRGQTWVEYTPSGRPVKFDSYQNGTLIEVKGPGYADLLQDRGPDQPYPRKGVVQGLLAQAKRQADVAGDQPIAWYVAEEQAATEISALLRSESYGEEIEILHVPPYR